MLRSAVAVTPGMIAVLLLALTGRVNGVAFAREHLAPPKSGSFRSIAVPYQAIMASREAVSSLPTSLANGHLLAYVPNSPATSDLFLFLPGSTQRCEVYTQLLETLAVSVRLLCIPYDNRKMIGVLCAGDSRCFPDLRLEAFNGSFDHVPGNNIQARLASALAYLARTDGGAWSGYLDAATGLPLWSRVRAAGHSQGAGAAAFIGYQRELARVVQFSGVCDLSDWTRRLGPPATPEGRFFGFASSYDSLLCPVPAQVYAWRAEGALPEGSWPVQLGIGDSLAIRSLGNSHTVISSILPPGCTPEIDEQCDLKAHDSTALNMWPSHPPYADGLWQALCGV
mmetsp:Transcript_58524/g.171211  ORF Transcript_58524/g.171211 Transcript_58524/m.171211 type:complete len:339 (-) Transcript_58524:39-1055(-)